MDFLKDLTDLSRKHGIIVFDDFAQVKNTYTSMKGLQMGWDNVKKEYAAIDKNGEHLLGGLPEVAEIVNESIANIEPVTEEVKPK